VREAGIWKYAFHLGSGQVQHFRAGRVTRGKERLFSPRTEACLNVFSNTHLHHRSSWSCIWTTCSTANQSCSGKAKDMLCSQQKWHFFFFAECTQYQLGLREIAMWRFLRRHFFYHHNPLYLGSEGEKQSEGGFALSICFKQIQLLWVDPSDESIYLFNCKTTKCNTGARPGEVAL